MQGEGSYHVYERKLDGFDQQTHDWVWYRFILGMSSNIFSVNDAPGKKNPIVKIVNLFVNEEKYEGMVSWE